MSLSDRDVAITITANLANEQAFKQAEAHLDLVDKASRTTAGSTDDLSAAGGRLSDIFSNSTSIRGFTNHIAMLGGGMNSTERAALYLASRLSSASAMMTALGGVAVVAGILALANAVKSSADEIASMEAEAVKLHMTFDELTTSRYGMLIDKGITDDIKHAEAETDNFLNHLKGGWLQTRVAMAKEMSDFFGLVGKYAQNNPLVPAPIQNLASLTTAAKNAPVDTLPSSKEAVKDFADLQNNIFNLTYEGYEKRQKVIDEEVAYYDTKYKQYPLIIDAVNKYHLIAEQRLNEDLGQERDKLLANTLKAEGKDEEAFTLTEEAKRTQLEKTGWYTEDMINRLITAETRYHAMSRLGIEDEGKLWDNLAKTSLSNVESTLADVFVDGLNNKFANASQLAQTFFQGLEKMAFEYAEKLVVLGIFNMVTGAMSGGGSTLGGFDTFAGESNWGMSSIPQYAAGGTVANTGLAMVHRGEEVLPANKANDGGGSDVNYYISANDAKSFVTMLQQNPDAIHSIVSQSIRGNKSIRKTIRDIGN